MATIEEVFTTKIEGFTDKVRNAVTNQAITENFPLVINIDSETWVLLNINIEYYLSNNGEFYCHIDNDTKTKFRVPISAKLHILKNEAKMQTFTKAGIVKSGSSSVDFCISLPMDSETLDRMVDENGALTIRVEITILPCCLSVVGVKRPYELELDVAPGQETKEKKIRANALDSHAIDMSSLREKSATENFSDLTISCQGKTFPVHKAILAARSAIFSAMLMHDTKEAKEQKIEIEDVDADTMEIFLEYIYGSKLPCLDKEQACSLMIMGDKYNVGALVQACQLYLLDDLQASDLVQVAILGDLINDDKLKNAAISKMGEHDGPLNELKDWHKLRGCPDLALEIATKMKK